MKVSSVYGRNVISTTGKRGYVISVNADGGKLVSLVCADETDEREFTVDTDSVKIFGETIVFDDGQAAPCAATPIRLGRAGYDDKGAYLGILEEITFSGKKLIKAKIGKKNYPADELILGDVVIVKSGRTLRANVEKDGKIILKKGARLTPEALERALQEGEYVQTHLKSL